MNDYEIEIYRGKNVITTMTIRAKDEKQAIEIAAESLKITVKKHYEKE